MKVITVSDSPGISQMDATTEKEVITFYVMSSSYRWPSGDHMTVSGTVEIILGTISYSGCGSIFPIENFFFFFILDLD